MYNICFFLYNNKRKGDGMDLNIRSYIRDNFKDSTTEEIEESINEALTSKEEVTLPGLGVFFEILWNHSDADTKETLLETIKQGL